MKLVSAVTDHSCVLACLESILADCGLCISQEDMLQDRRLLSLFPFWAESPGLLHEHGAPHDYSGALEICKVLGIASDRRLLYEPNDIIEAMLQPTTIGAILNTSRYYGADNQIHDGNRHAMRIIGVSSIHFVVMNPGRNGFVGLEVHKWADLKLFGSCIALLESLPKVGTAENSHLEG